MGGFSGNAVRPIALRFISELSQNEKLKGKHISGMGGIETWKDALSFMLLGATSVQVTTAVMQYGYRIIDDLKEGLLVFLQERNLTLKDVIGGMILGIGFAVAAFFIVGAIWNKVTKKQLPKV